MSSTPEDGEAEQHGAEALGDESTIPDFQDETTATIDREDQLEQTTPDFEEDVDTIPQLSEPAAGYFDDHQTINVDGVPQHSREGDETITRPESIDDSASIPDDTPSIQASGVSSPRSDAGPKPALISRKSSAASRRPFELRFQSRLSSSYINTPRASSPAFLNTHSRHSSLASFAPPSDSAAEDAQTPWEVIRWTKLKRLTGQAFSEVGRRNFGNPTCLAVSDQIVIGTSRGLILVFDHQQNNKATIGLGTKAAEAGAVTALAISADHTAIAAGHANGNIFVWEVMRPARPFMQIAALDAAKPEARKGDGHLEGSAVLHVGFLGYRRTALVSADDKGMAFSHLATRGTGSLARSIKTTRVLGRYPELIVRATSKPIKKSSVLAFSPLPLGNIEQKTDNMGLVAMLTPYLLVIVSTTPIAQTQHKLARPKEVAAHSAMTAALAWFPSIKLKGSESIMSKNKLVYAWSNVLNVLEVEEVTPEPDAPQDKPLELQFVSRSHYVAEEAIVAVQWLSRSVIAALTITQQLLVVEDVSMHVTDSFDLLPKHLYHADLYSHQLQNVVEHHDEDEESSMHGVVADGYYMSFRGYKGRLFLLGSNDVWWGSLTNWADRLLAMIETGDFIGAIRLATNYYAGSGEKVTIGLPEDDVVRKTLVHDKLLEMMGASLRYAFGKNEQAANTFLSSQQFADLAVACVAACLRMNEQDFLFNDVFEWYDDNNMGGIFVDVLEPHILDREVTVLPPAALKVLINHFAKTRAPSQLEEIICLLDATAMDVDQVTTLCKHYNLYDAYIYVWNTALFDYTSPLAELLRIRNQENGINGVSMSRDQTNSQKMFPYLSFTLTGRIYPIGEFMDDERSLSAKSQIYELLFSGSGGEKNPFTLLRQILEYDTPSFFAALNEAFEDSFLNTSQDADFDASIDVNGVEQRSSLYNRQIIVRILLDVMSSDFAPSEQLYLDMFIARNLPKYPQYMLLAGTTLERLFTRLCDYEEEELHDEAQLSLEYLMTVYKPANITMFIPSLQKARFHRILKIVYRQEGEWTNLLRSYLDDKENRFQLFDLVVECLRPQSILDHDQRQDFIDELKIHVDEIVNIDAVRTAKTIDIVLPQEHSFFIQTIADIEAKHIYLSTLLEPQDGNSRSTHTTNAMIEDYMRLLCQLHPAHVIEYVSKIKEGELQLENVLPALEMSGNIDAAVVLLARQGEVQQAMDRLIKHLSTIEAALTGVLESAADSPDEVATNEAIEDLLSSVQKYAKVGIWLCQAQSQLTASKNKTPSKSPRRAPSQQPLSFEENLWLDLVVAVVAIAQRVGNAPSQVDVTNDTDEVTAALRTSIQDVFTALLNATTTTQGQVQSEKLRFVRILRAFLTRAAEISSSIAHFRHIMSSVFSAYAYEESLLSLSNAMLDKDLFVQVDDVNKQRLVGWRPRGQVCGICRRRVWGPGLGLQTWDAWERDEKDRTRSLEEFRRQSIVGSEATEDESRGKGKAAVILDEHEDADIGPSRSGRNMGPIAVFSCRHLFHVRCLEQSQEINVDGSGGGVDQLHEDGTERRRLRCPACL